jgi:hypothetical protein
MKSVRALIQGLRPCMTRILRLRSSLDKAEKETEILKESNSVLVEENEKIGQKEY